MRFLLFVCSSFSVLLLRIVLTRHHSQPIPFEELLVALGHRWCLFSYHSVSQPAPSMLLDLCPFRAPYFQASRATRIQMPYSLASPWLVPFASPPSHRLFSKKLSPARSSEGSANAEEDGSAPSLPPLPHSISSQANSECSLSRPFESLLTLPPTAPSSPPNLTSSAPPQPPRPSNGTLRHAQQPSPRIVPLSR